ncbi:serine acetyltransferase [Maribacter sp.]|uniref:serine acetyltransferase n=1 Tax=Maribacter sp. TaxID=1897614 RepID=UPI0025B94E11|nr:serine acetyltransferase [Maribacter sp.]
MNKHIKYDLFRYTQKTTFKFLIKAWLKKPGFKYSYYLRKISGHNLNSISGLYYRYMLKKLTYKYGIQIPINTKIGKGLFIGHFGNIVINNDAIIGENCNIAHGVTIGQTNRGKYKGCPIIGDKVWIGTGSVIVGKINIGSNVLIAPLTYVNQNIPSNSIVKGNPMVIIENKNATKEYINNILN